MKKAKNKIAPINIHEYDGKMLYIEQFSSKLQERLRPKLFAIERMEDLYYEALKLISPINKKLRKTPNSIKACIINVLNHFNFFDIPVTLHKLTDNGEKEIKIPKKRYLEEFQTYILGFDKLPKEQLAKLLPKVETDLNDINQLVKEYEANPVVIKFLEEKRTAYNHKDKTIIDFYLRCLNKRQEVLDYYLNGVYDRALDKSRPQLIKGITPFFNKLYDFPYLKWGHRKYGVSLNYKDIDSVSHRIRSFYDEEHNDLEELYASNKESFYRKIFRKRSKKEMLASIQYHLSYIHLVNDRQTIFIELEKLFSSRKWLAYYALALPQVEGLFAEMVKTKAPNSKIVQKALSDKVRFVRPDHIMSDYYFDYYEYVLPEQRNSFMHSGYTNETDIKLKAFDMLTDLDHVLETFASLENPLIKIKNLMGKRDQLLFSNAKAFAEFFQLIEDLHSKHKTNNKLNEEIKEFSHNFLRVNCSAEYLLQEDFQNLSERIEEASHYLYDELKDFGFKKDWRKIGDKKIKKLVLEENFKVRFEEIFSIKKSLFESLLISKIFVEGAFKYVFQNKIPPELESEESIWQKEKGFLYLLSTLSKIIEPKIRLE